MQTYLVSYDLADPAFNRNALNSAIMMLGQSWARPLAQTWYVRTDLGEEDIESLLRGLLQADDGLLIQSVDDEARLAGTRMRWFRQRPLLQDGAATNIVAFPVVAEPTIPANDGDAQMPLAEAG
jgi:hypothetical protein